MYVLSYCPLHHFQVRSVQRVAVRNSPLFVCKIEGEAPLIQLAQRRYIFWPSLLSHLPDQVHALRTAALDQVWIEPHDVGTVMNVAGRKVLFVSGLEEPS